MKCYFLLLCSLFSAIAKESPPTIKVYSQNPVKFGEENTLVCHITGFYPDDIHTELLENAEKIPGAKQSALGMNSDGTFDVFNKASFTPESGSLYVCHVKHVKNEKTVTWEPDV